MHSDLYPPAFATNPRNRPRGPVAPPADGSAALALDKETSRKSLALQGTPRWELAIKDANPIFPEAAEAFSSVIGIPITGKYPPYLYMLLRRTLTDALLARGREFGKSRIACNVHWQSDVNWGSFMGAATVTRLHADAGFPC